MSLGKIFHQLSGISHLLCLHKKAGIVKNLAKNLLWDYHEFSWNHSEIFEYKFRLFKFFSGFWVWRFKASIFCTQNDFSQPRSCEKWIFSRKEGARDFNKISVPGIKIYYVIFMVSLIPWIFSFFSVYSFKIWVRLSSISPTISDMSSPISDKSSQISFI